MSEVERVFSTNLKRLRLAKQLTQEQTAEALGVSPQAISRWECGATLPDVLRLPEIARLYGVTTDDLYQEESKVYANYAQRLTALYERTMRAEDFQRAEQEYQRMFEAKKDSPDDRRLYGILYHYRMNQCKRMALDCFERLIAADADGDEEVLFWTRGQRQNLLADIGRNAECIAEQRTRIEAGNADWREYSLLLAAYCREGEYAIAYEFFCQAVERFPESWVLYTHGGEILQGLQRMEEAFACWERALRLNPKGYDAQYARAEGYERVESYDKACWAWRDLAENLKMDGFEIESHAAQDCARRCQEKWTGKVL